MPLPFWKRNAPDSGATVFAAPPPLAQPGLHASRALPGGGPNSVLKCLIVWESCGRDCYYSDLASALEISEDTAYQTMNKGKKWIKNAFGLNVEHSGERIFLVSNQSLAQKAERLDGHIQKAAKAIEALQSDVNSIRQSGQTPVLPGTAGALLAGYEQAKQLEASNG